MKAQWHASRLAVLLLGLTLLAACGGGGTAPAAQPAGNAPSTPTPTATPVQKLTPVSLRVDVFFYGAHVPLLAGIEEGIYRKHGLDVTASEGTGSATTIQTVANGADNFGFADGGTLVKTAAKGVPAQMVVGMIETSPMVVVSLPGSGITKPTDLNGKTGGFTPGSAPEQIFPAFAKKTGIRSDTIHQVSLSITARDAAFLEKKTDFSFGYTVTQVPIFEEKCNCTLNAIKYADFGLNPMSNGIITSDAFAAAHPDVVKNFAAATVDAIQFSIQHPQEAVDDFFRYATKTQLSKQVVSQQWQAMVPLLHTQATKDNPVGCMASSDWQNTIDLLVTYGGVDTGSVSPDKVYTNKFLPSAC